MELWSCAWEPSTSLAKQPLNLELLQNKKSRAGEVTQPVKSAEKRGNHIQVKGRADSELSSVSMGCGTPTPDIHSSNAKGNCQCSGLNSTLRPGPGLCECRLYLSSEHGHSLRCHLRSWHGDAHPAFMSSRSSPVLGVQGCLGVQEARANNRILNLLTPWKNPNYKGKQGTKWEKRLQGSVWQRASIEKIVKFPKVRRRRASSPVRRVGTESFRPSSEHRKRFFPFRCHKEPRLNLWGTLQAHPAAAGAEEGITGV